MPTSSPTPDVPEPMPDERLEEIKNLLRYETSISFHSARAKESLLLLVAEVYRLRTQRRFLLEQVRRKDAASGQGDRALAEFLAENSEPAPELTDADERALTALHAAVYVAVDAFQRAHRLPGLQHAQWRDYLTEYVVSGLFEAGIRPAVEVLDEAPFVTLTAEWECGYGPNEDEPYCQEDDSVHPGEECPTVRVHRDDRHRFAAMVEEIHDLKRSLAAAANRTSRAAALDEAADTVAGLVREWEGMSQLAQIVEARVGIVERLRSLAAAARAAQTGGAS